MRCVNRKRLAFETCFEGNMDKSNFVKLKLFVIFYQLNDCL